MLIYGFIYTLIIGTILLLPKELFLGLLNKIKELKNVLKIEQNFEHLRGKKLIYLLSTIEWHFTNGGVEAKSKLPQFKFYTDLILEYKAMTLKYGVKLKQLINELRPHLVNDQKLATEIYQEISNGIAQFAVVSLITWGFIYFSLQLVTINVSGYIYFSILFLQIIGLIFFLVTANYMKRKIFYSIGKSICELIIFKSQIDVGISVNLALENSQILKGTFSQEKKFKTQFSFFLDIIERFVKKGQSPKEDLLTLTESLFEEQSSALQNFKKGIQISKFLHLALIYLPAYFLYLASIYKFFMEQ